MLKTLLVFSILNGKAKMNLAILAFLYCKEIVKNSNVYRNKCCIHECVQPCTHALLIQKPCRFTR